MEKMGATKEGVLDLVKDSMEVEIREGPPGEEAIRRTTPPPALEGGEVAGAPLVKGEAKGAGKDGKEGKVGKVGKVGKGAKGGPSPPPAPPPPAGPPEGS